MILALEIALAVYGLLGLITGTLIVSRTKAVQGARARLLGALTLVPVVAAFVLIFTLPSTSPSYPWIEGGIVGLVAVLVFGIGAFIGVNPDEKRPAEDEEPEPEAVEPPPQEQPAEPVAAGPSLTEVEIIANDP